MIEPTDQDIAKALAAGDIDAEYVSNVRADHESGGVQWKSTWLHACTIAKLRIAGRALEQIAGPPYPKWCGVSAIAAQKALTQLKDDANG